MLMPSSSELYSNFGDSSSLGLLLLIQQKDNFFFKKKTKKEKKKKKKRGEVSARIGWEK